MKKITAIILFFCFQALLIFFEVHKQGQYVQLNYEIQKLQSKLCKVTKEYNDLTYAYYNLQQPELIEKKAIELLNMKNIELQNIKVVEVS